MSSQPFSAAGASVQRLITPARLGVYGADPAHATSEYLRNLEVTAALARLIALGEVFLRNAIDLALKEHLGAHGDWVPTARELLCPQGRRRLAHAQRSALADRGVPDQDETIARLGLGFWVHLMAAEHTHSLWVPAVRHAFPSLRPQVRDVAYKQARRMLKLRNRIAHHEKVTRRDPEAAAVGILELLSWIDPAAADWAAEVCRSDIPGLRLPESRWST